MPASNDLPDLAALRGVIWDLDNTLYRFDRDFEQACNLAAARAALKGGVEMSLEDAVAFGWESYRLRGHSYDLFLERFALDRVRMHHDFHDAIDETLIKKSAALAALFDRVALGHALVTHASRGWAVRTLDHLGLRPFFPDERIFAAEDSGFERKSESRRAFDAALHALDLPPGQAMVVEDIAGNLRIPKEMGLLTGLVHYGRPPEPLPAHIDWHGNNAADFLEAVQAAKRVPG